MRIVINASSNHRVGALSRKSHCSAHRACVNNECKLTMEHILRKPIESRGAYRQRRNTMVLAMVLSLGMAVALAIGMLG